MSGVIWHAITSRCLLVSVVFATLATVPAQAAETKERKPLTKPGQTYVGIDVTGCAEQCPSYEIVLFDNGRMMFRANNEFTSQQGLANRTPFGNQYKQLVAYISSGDFFKDRPSCAEATGHTGVTLSSTVGGEEKEATYRFGCPADAATATALISRFVDQSGTWKLINRDWEYWAQKKFDSK